MTAMFTEDVTVLCGPDGKHNPDRAGYRHATGAGSVTLSGRRCRSPAQTARGGRGPGNCAWPAMTCSAAPRCWARWRWRRCLRTCRRAATAPGLEPVGEQADQAATATSKSAVWRRFVAATETALAELMGRDLPAWTWLPSWWTGFTSVRAPAWACS